MVKCSERVPMPANQHLQPDDCDGIDRAPVKADRARRAPAGLHFGLDGVFDRNRWSRWDKPCGARAIETLRLIHAEECLPPPKGPRCSANASPVAFRVRHAVGALDEALSQTMT
jgi:hypothetical protein